MVYFSLNILREHQVGWSSFRLTTGHFSGSSSKKVSLLACGREDDQKGDEGEGLEKITEAEKGALRRGAGRGGVISQNWRDRTAAFFAVLGS